MWVKSQNGRFLVNLNRTKKLEVAVKYTHKRGDAQDISVADGYAVRTEDTLLGVYPTEDSAKRALKYIEEELLQFGHESGYTVKMPKREDEKAGDGV